MNIKCFFGFHDWEYKKQSEYHHDRVLGYRECKKCNRAQCYIIVTSLTPESRREMETKSIVWVNCLKKEVLSDILDSVLPKPTPEQETKTNNEIAAMSVGEFHEWAASIGAMDFPHKHSGMVAKTGAQE